MMQNKTTLSDCANLVSQNNIIYNNINRGKNFTASEAVSDEMEIEDCAQGIGLMGHIRHIGLIKMRAGNAIDNLKSLSFETCEERIALLTNIEATSTIDKAIYLAHARIHFFTRSADWLTWAKVITKNDDRTIYRYLKVGNMLLSLPQEYYYMHNKTDIEKLELIASLGSNDQKVMLSDERLTEMSRDELRAECARLKGTVVASKPDVDSDNHDQLDFFDALDGLDKKSFGDDKVMCDFANKFEPQVIFDKSLCVLEVLNATIKKVNFIKEIPQYKRAGLALHFREMAAEIEADLD